MQAMVVIAYSPFDPLDRTVQRVRRRARIRSLAPRGAAPVMAMLNGRPVLRAEWRRKLSDGDHLVFVRLPRGGEGSNPLQAILSIALLVFAPQIAVGILGEAAAASVLVGSFTLGQAVTLGIVVAGNALISALVPIQKPSAAPTPSPTYSLQAQGNLARLESALPVQYGRILSYPDFAAQPYVEYSGNEQYLYQLLCVGAGEYDIEEIRIEDTPLSAFAEIETEIISPGEQITLFPTNVISSVEVSGQEIPHMSVGNWATDGTTMTVQETGHGRAAGESVDLVFHPGLQGMPPRPPNGEYVIATTPDENTFTIASTWLEAFGQVDIRTFLGGDNGFTAAAAGTVAHRLGVDLVFPTGLFIMDDQGRMIQMAVTIRFEARRLDDAGQPLEGWQLLAEETITDKTVTPVRKSYNYQLATPDRYAVRAMRTSALHAGGAGNQSSQVVFAGLRSYLREHEEFGDVTLLAMRMQATNNLSQQASRKISVLSTRKLPVWDGVSWSTPQPTRSIAWALADAARNTHYGAALPDRRVDLDALRALDAVWTARGDRFDGRFDQSQSWWDAAQQILTTGRAKPFMQGGQLRVVRDGPETTPVAMYSMRNIRRGSFAVDYLMATDDTADSVRVQYFDEATWSMQKVTATLPGSTATRPADVDLSRGITVRAHAMREAQYLAASNRYRRRPFKFSTEMEGFIPSLGDLIAVSHDMPSWGQHAEVTSWSASSRFLEVTEPLTFGSGAHYVALRRRDGSVSGPWMVKPGRHEYEIRLTEDPDFTPQTGFDEERTHVAFGQGENWGVLAKVLKVRPRGIHDVEIEAVVEDPRVHTADIGMVAAPRRQSQLPGRVVRPVVSGLLARRMPNENLRAVVAWQPAPGAETYQLEMAEGDDPSDPNVTWTRAEDTPASHHAITLLYADRTMIRVRGMGLAAGPWAAATIGDLIPSMWNTNATPMWTIDTNAMWSAS